MHDLAQRGKKRNMKRGRESRRSSIGRRPRAKEEEVEQGSSDRCHLTNVITWWPCGVSLVDYRDVSPESSLAAFSIGAKIVQSLIFFSTGAMEC